MYNIKTQSHIKIYYKLIKQTNELLENIGFLYNITYNIYTIFATK